MLQPFLSFPTKKVQSLFLHVTFAASPTIPLFYQIHPSYSQYDHHQQTERPAETPSAAAIFLLVVRLHPASTPARAPAAAHDEAHERKKKSQHDPRAGEHRVADVVVYQILPVVQAKLDEGFDQGAVLFGFLQLLFVCGRGEM